MKHRKLQEINNKVHVKAKKANRPRDATQQHSYVGLQAGVEAGL